QSGTTTSITTTSTRWSRSRGPTARTPAGSTACTTGTRPAKRHTDMAKLIYSAIMSLDGYVADERGNFDWAAPDEEVHRFVNELERPVGTYLLGRRMYDTLLYWENPPGLDAKPAVIKDFAAIWRGADTVVYSTTLEKAQ